jgi:hypothetical protein
MDSCPRINIQGNIGTCALWSLFIFYAFVLYPNRKDIFETLRGMTPNERNLLLIIFIYTIYSIATVDIKKTIRLSQIKPNESILEVVKLFRETVRVL